MTPLRSLRPGQRARIIDVHGGGAIRQRLLELGILPSETVELQRVAPSGNPLWVRLGNSQISLRGPEAATIEVEVL